MLRYVYQVEHSGRPARINILVIPAPVTGFAVEAEYTDTAPGVREVFYATSRDKSLRDEEGILSGPAYMRDYLLFRLGILLPQDLCRSLQIMSASSAADRVVEYDQAGNVLMLAELASEFDVEKYFPWLVGNPATSSARADLQTMGSPVRRETVVRVAANSLPEHAAC